MEIPRLVSKEFLLQVPKIKINSNNSTTVEGCCDWYNENYPRPIYGNNYNIIPFSKPYFAEPDCIVVGSEYNHCD